MSELTSQQPRRRTNLPRYVSDSSTLYFFHLPKTAGSSLEFSLTSRYLPEQIALLPSWKDLINIPSARLADYRFISGHFYNQIYHMLPYSPLTVTILRDPVARSVSHYRHIWRLSEFYLHQKAHDLGSLMAFLQDADGRAFFTNFQTRILAYELDAATLNATLRNTDQGELMKVFELAMQPGISDMELLERAKTRLDSFEFVGLSERIQELIWLLDYQYGWWPSPEVPRENVAPVNQEYGHVSPKAIALLREITGLDAELYRYAEQRLSSDVAQMTLELLREHTFVSSHIDVQQVIEVPFDYHLPGLGWYLPERNAVGQFYRWLGPASNATVFLSLLVDRSVRITGFIFAGMTFDILNSLTLVVEDAPVPLLIEAATQYSYRFTGTILAGSTSATGLTRLNFRVSHTISPHQVDPQSLDTRSLSLAFSWLRLSYDL